MTQFNLYHRLIDCPIYWQNFITTIQKDSWRDVPEETIQRELSRYNAALVAEEKMYGIRECVKFSNEKDYMLFVMKWS